MIDVIPELTEPHLLSRRPLAESARPELTEVGDAAELPGGELHLADVPTATSVPV